MRYHNGGISTMRADSYIILDLWNDEGVSMSLATTRDMLKGDTLSEMFRHVLATYAPEFNHYGVNYCAQRYTKQEALANLRYVRGG